jgi:adenosylmethionine-8-amino-7-oxononanoate aminotransferase
MAVQFWLNKGITERSKFVAFKGGYHGDTFAAMSVCDPEEGMHGLFAKVLPRQIIAGLPIDPPSTQAFDALLEAHSQDLAAIIVEPLVQGAGGMLFHDAHVLRHLRAAADRHGLLLIFDEIFTGFGRTGTMFACEAAGVVPDIITLSKALTGGTMGLGATIASNKVFEAFLSDEPNHALMHGPTFMANPLACAAANASIDLFESEPRLAQVAAIEAMLARDLEPARDLPHVRDVRVKGAIGVVELDRIDDLGELKRRFVEAGVFVRPFRNIVYLTPAFTIGEEDFSRLTGVVVSVLENWTRL